MDSVWDIDDSLCHVALFANLSANGWIPSLLEDCARLCKEWQLYIINRKNLRKVSLSIEGVYYQAIVQGETMQRSIANLPNLKLILASLVSDWLELLQIPSEVDISVMLMLSFRWLVYLLGSRRVAGERWLYWSLSPAHSSLVSIQHTFLYQTLLGFVCFKLYDWFTHLH